MEKLKIISVIKTITIFPWIICRNQNDVFCSATWILGFVNGWQVMMKHILCQYITNKTPQALNLPQLWYNFPLPARLPPEINLASPLAEREHQGARVDPRKVVTSGPVGGLVSIYIYLVTNMFKTSWNKEFITDWSCHMGSIMGHICYKISWHTPRGWLATSQLGRNRANVFMLAGR